MANSIIVSALQTYIDQTSIKDFMYNALFEGDTIKTGITIMSGFQKGTVAVPVISDSLTWQDSACDLDESGTVSMTQVLATLKSLSSRKKLCYEDLRPTFAGNNMPKETLTMTAPDGWVESFLAAESNLLKTDVEKFMWIGSSTGTFSAAYTKVDGVLHYTHLTSASASVTYAAATYSNFTIDNTYDLVQAVALDRPSTLRTKPNQYAYTSPELFEMYIASANKLNKFHYGAEEGQGEIKIHGFNIILKSTEAFEGMKVIYLTHSDNIMYFLSDISENNGGKIEFVDNNEKDYIMEKIDITMGFAVKFPQNVSLWYKK